MSTLTDLTMQENLQYKVSITDVSEDILIHFQANGSNSSPNAVILLLATFFYETSRILPKVKGRQVDLMPLVNFQGSVQVLGSYSDRLKNLGETQSV